MATQSAVSAAHSFNKILNQPRGSKSRGSDLEDGRKKLRRMILVEGIPSSVVRACNLNCIVHHSNYQTQDPTLRPRIWKILLSVNDMPAETFLQYVARGPCQVRE